MENIKNELFPELQSIKNELFPELHLINPPVLIISTYIFVVVGICYLIFKLLFDSSVIQLITNSISPNILLTIYQHMIGSKFILFLLVFLTITLSLLFFVYRLILGGSPEHYTNVYGCISVCFFTTVFITFILLEIFPYLVTIFENTIGYLWICCMYPTKINDFNNLFSQTTKYPDEIEISYKFLITLMSLYNMDRVLDDFKPPTVQPTNQPVINKIFITPPNNIQNKDISELCFIKYSTGHFVWIYFASLVCTFTSIKAFSKYLI